ncbi:MAG: YdjY domain-containing protein [Planctomycetota bacterium]
MIRSPSFSVAPWCATLLCLLSLIAVCAPAVERGAVEDVAMLERLAGLMEGFPLLDPVSPRQVDAPAKGQRLAEGLYLGEDRVVMEGVVLVDQGPVDGLEVIACLEGGKNHESLVRLFCNRADLTKAAFLAAFDPPDGAPAPEASGQPARGTPLRVRLFWQRLDPLTGSSTWMAADASTLVRNRQLRHPYPPLPYVYTGSQFRTVHETLPDGTTQRVERFMLTTTRSVVVNFDEPDTLLASPFPLSARDDFFEVNSGVRPPPPETPVLVVFEALELPLTIDTEWDGEDTVLHHADAVIDRGALANLLLEHYGPKADPTYRAVGLRVAPEVPRSADLELRQLVLELAAGVDAWVVPVFVIDPDAEETSTPPEAPPVGPQVPGDAADRPTG